MTIAKWRENMDLTDFEKRNYMPGEASIAMVDEQAKIRKNVAARQDRREAEWASKPLLTNGDKPMTEQPQMRRSNIPLREALSRQAEIREFLGDLADKDVHKVIFGRPTDWIKRAQCQFPRSWTALEALSYIDSDVIAEPYDLSALRVELKIRDLYVWEDRPHQATPDEERAALNQTPFEE